MFSIETQGINTYLSYKLNPDDKPDSLSLGMISNNRIKGVAPILFSQIDEDRYFKWGISAKLPLRKFLAGVVKRAGMLSVIKGIIEVFIAAEDYMIESSMFVLDTAYIYVDVAKCEPTLICLTLSAPGGEPPDLPSFFKGLIFDARYDGGEENDYVAVLINALNCMDVFSLGDFLLLIKEMLQAPRTTIPQNALQNALQTTHQPAQPPAQPAVSLPPPPQVIPLGPMAAATPAIQAAPAAQAAPVEPAAPVGNRKTHPPQNSEKKVTFMQLLMHYDKEHKEAYRAQKEAKSANPGPTRGKAAGKNEFAVPGVQAPIKQAHTQSAQLKPPLPSPLPQSPPPQSQAPQPMAPQPMGPMPAGFPTVGDGQTHPSGETTVLSGKTSCETTVLNMGADMLTPFLSRARTNEKVMLDKPIFRIGKELSFADYFIGDNPAVSRCHAEFSVRDGQCFVTDINSTNHTFVNGSIINSGTEVRLEHGDRVALANEEFSFRLY